MSQRTCFAPFCPADGVAVIGPGDSFPCTGAAWNPLAREPAACLMWAAATDSLSDLDMESLRNYAGQMSWLSYGMAIHALVAFHAQTKPAQMTDL